MGILMDIFKKRRQDAISPDLNEEEFDPEFSKAVRDRMRNSRNRVREVE